MAEAAGELFERAVATELGRPRRGKPVTFPLIRSELPPVSEAEITAASETDSESEDLRRAFGRSWYVGPLLALIWQRHGAVLRGRHHG